MIAKKTSTKKTAKKSSSKKVATKKQLDALRKGREALKKKQAQAKKAVRKELAKTKKAVKKATSKIMSTARKRASKATSKQMTSLSKRLKKKGLAGTTKELESKVRDLGFSGYGHHKIEIIWHGKSYTFTTTNMPATDRLTEKNHISDRASDGMYTYKGALQALYDEGKRKNNLGEYSY